MTDRHNPHDEAEELLPWYATGQLGSAERTIVEMHLSSCDDCRAQLTLERRLIDQFRGMEPQVDAGWAQLRTMVEPPQRATHRPRFQTQLWKVVRHPAVAMVAAAQVAFVIAAGALLLSMSRPAYHALGSAPPPATADVIVIFRPDASVDDIRTALRSANASIVGGPTAADAFLLRVPVRQRQQALARLRADDDVQMAEPIDGSLQ
jgi:anti-sigma factor RsiW